MKDKVIDVLFKFSLIKFVIEIDFFRIKLIRLR